MDGISRKTFLDELAAGGGAIDPHDLGPGLVRALGADDALGVDPADLEAVAGRDGRIQGRAEWGRLYDLMDRAGDGLPAGLHEELRAEVARRRAEAGRAGVIHLGMRPASVAEADALRSVVPARRGGVHSIQGAAVQDTIRLGGATFTLDTPAGRADFRRAVVGEEGMDPARADALIALLADQPAGARDEAAQLALAFYRTGTGELAASRLVLSGHSWGEGVLDDAGNHLTWDAVGALAGLFPEGAGRIRHLAIAACYNGHAAQIAQFRAMFPNLQSAWMYGDSAPLAESPAAGRDLRDWERRSQGGPGRVDPGHGGLVTWNVVDGMSDRPEPLDVIERRVAGREAVAAPYQAAPPPCAPHDDDLDRYYQSLVELEYHPDLPAERRAAVHGRRMEVLRWRHPELFPGPLREAQGGLR